MKKMMAVWIFLALCLFGSIFFIGFSLNKEYKPYRELEADMKESASIYIIMEKIKIKQGEKLRITSSDLLESEALDSMNVKDDECTGYVIVKKSTSDNEYEAYIKCENYTSVDYEE